ncbi:CRISPR-associated endoribonuclease Cas6 [Clostridioides difficile]|uniref:CRISPR-associated endoribonuclease Cas6 n=2 Tax=Clostridioides difficile TaxID=1496 RepID=UPI000BB1B682|nr:CRISPR-associated endoribonuclease Cas6 [Clostridioides difficile]MBF9869156.1 CRISPR-associated endoribonuclease Cas6 [Clostridioides difficile]MBH7044069.1 CRISPR-associated endoribonuclease Cas6 [Clostridioides difficile]MBY1215242.1 CRISPR-associated endoribonuclease Cas6 [Clostridioides difficile]MBZ1030178.1 CRISPR-associated endoribonuclease Cas6 [Clostridioides difficile]MCA0682473.1 CRISPR-associated endoribonuclease Cas6 [Clostridioides difficile]
MIKCLEMSVKVYLLENISLDNTSKEIRKLIDDTLIIEEKYKEFHNKAGFKNYSFNLLYPLEKDKVYKKDCIYTFIIRTVDIELGMYFMNNLKNQYSDKIKVITMSKKVIPKKHIESIYSVTPIIAKFEDGYWRSNKTVEDLEKRIRENLIKKYNEFTNSKIDEDFELFQVIKFINRKPISTKYKNISLLGDKISFKVSENDMAQEIANFALGVGVGEINSRGFGFVNYRWL